MSSGIRFRPLLFLFTTAWYALGTFFYLQASSSYKLVVYNLNNYSVQGADNLPAKSLASLSAIEAVLGTLKPDILTITEMGSWKDLLFLQQKLKGIGLLLPYAVVVNATDPVRHLALLSRCPIERNDSLLLVPTFIPKHFVKRGFMDVTLRLGTGCGSTLRIVGVHLKSRRAPTKQSYRIRYAEAQALSSHVKNILQHFPESNLLVVGDFNDRPTSPTLKMILQPKIITPDRMATASLQGAQLPQQQTTTTILTDLVPSDQCGERWTHRFAKDDVYSRLDYLLASSGVIHKIVETGICHHPQWNRASDHRPLYVTISFPFR